MFFFFNQLCPEGQCLFLRNCWRGSRKSNRSEVSNCQTLTLGKPNLVISCWTYYWAATANRGCGYTDISFSGRAVSNSSFAFFSPPHRVGGVMWSLWSYMLGQVRDLIFNLGMFYSSPPQTPQIKNGGELQKCIAGVEE